MKFSALCLRIIGLGGTAATASVLRDLQASSASCIPYGSDPLDGKTVIGDVGGYSWTVSGGEDGVVIATAGMSGYLMGKFDRIEGNVAYYTDGDLCGQTPRTVVLTFKEDCSYDDMQITYVETSSCNYPVEITGVCYCSSSSVPSSQPSLSLMPSFVPTHPGEASGQQFTKVGPGRCRDSAGQSYSFVLGDVFSMDEPQSCYDWCTQANEEKLVGFDLYNIFCFCLLDRNHDAKLADYKDPSPRSGILDAQGAGDIGGLSTQTSYDCYQIENSVPVTTSVPSSQPSLSLMPSSEPTHPGWKITYDSMKANLTVGSTEELIFVYNISSSQAYEYKLLEKDCSTEIKIEIGGNLITDNWTSKETIVDGTDRLALFYDINMTAVPSSPIWNQTSEQMEMCLLLSLFEPATADDPRMIIVQDKHVFTVGVNSTVDFTFDNALQDADVGEDLSTANLDSYIEACKCTEDDMFECDSSPLAPNEEFHVCVKSSSPDVRISDVSQMNIDQGDQSLNVIVEGDIKYPSFSSKKSYPDENGYKINVLLPINLFNFSGSNVTVEGTLEMQLGDGRRALRKLASGNGREAAPFRLEVALTDTPMAPEINDAVEEDSAPPGFLVPVLAVVGSVSLLAMAGMAVAIKKRGSQGSGGIVA